MSDADYDEWFCGVIAFYRGLDFFTSGAFTGLSEAECQKRIEGPHTGWYQESYRQAVRHGRAELAALETWIIKADELRVWFQDSEWVYGDTRFYQTGVTQLGRISRALFQPDRPLEVWGSSEEVDGVGQIIRVTFQACGEEHRMWIWRDTDFANTGFVAAVNDLIRPSGQRFRIYGADQDWAVICQTEIEASAMFQHGHVVRDINHVSGLLQYPGTTVLADPQPRDRWLYAERGVCRHSNGDADGAWEDFRQAARLGMWDVYFLIE